MVEALIAFCVALFATLSLYLVAKLKAPKSTEDVNKRSTYACGERLSIESLKTTITLYKYLVYFVLMDASALLLAFSSLAWASMSLQPLLIYLLLTLTASLILFTGGGE